MEGGAFENSKENKRIICGARKREFFATCFPPDWLRRRRGLSGPFTEQPLKNNFNSFYKISLSVIIQTGEDTCTSEIKFPSLHDPVMLLEF